MYCNNCGQELKDGARFCSKCGNYVSVGIRQPEQVSKSVKKGRGKLMLIGILLGLCVLILLGTGGFYVYKTQFAELYLAAVQNQDGKWGYIDKSGKEVIACQFDITYMFGSNGLAVVGKRTDSDSVELEEWEKTYKWGLINTKGEMVIPFSYDEMGMCFDKKDGLLAVGKSIGINEYGNQIIHWGFINEEGEEVVPIRYYAPSKDNSFFKHYSCNWGDDEIMLVQNEKEEYVFINRIGEEVVNVGTENPGSFYHYKVGNELYAIEGQYGVDKEGNTVYKWGFADKNNQIKIECQFDDYGRFAKNGLAPVAKQVGEDEDGEPILEWGYINRSGEAVIPFRFEEAKEFEENGLAAVTNTEGVSGAINESGKWVLELPENLKISFFAGNVAVVEDVDSSEFVFNCGLINKKGETILPCIYSFIRYDGYLIVVSKNETDEFKYGIVDENGSFITPVKYDYANGYGMDEWASVGFGTENKYKCEYIDKEGNTVLELPVEYVRAYPFIKVR